MKTGRMRLMAAAGLFLLAQPQMMHAASVLVDFSASYNDVTAPPFPFTDNTDPAAVTQATGPLNGSLTHYSTSSTATANFGSLLVNTAASGVSDEALSTNSKAGWVDSLTILGSSGSGTLKLYFALSGSMTAVDGGGGSVAVTTYNVTGDVNGNVFARTGAEHSSAGLIGNALSDFNVTTGTFTFGTPFNFDVNLLGAASYSGNLAAGSGTSSASNLQLTLTGIEVYDQFNVLVSSPDISSTSGTVYGVPEPSRVMLLAGGMAVLFLRRRYLSSPHTPP